MTVGAATVMVPAEPATAVAATAVSTETAAAVVHGFPPRFGAAKPSVAEVREHADHDDGGHQQNDRDVLFQIAVLAPGSAVPAPASRARDERTPAVTAAAITTVVMMATAVVMPAEPTVPAAVPAKTATKVAPTVAAATVHDRAPLTVKAADSMTAQLGR